MFTRIKNWLWTIIVEWLNGVPERNRQQQAINNTDHLLRDIRPADVILFEGRSRVGDVIKIITLSPWTHAALYIGRLVDIRDQKARDRVRLFYKGDEDAPLIIESLLGHGTIVTDLTKYPDDNLRVCRASELNYADQSKVVNFAIEHLGMLYDVRQLLDLARFMFPYAIVPRHWRSSLFQHNAGRPTHIVCSGMITRCFQSVNYPILPIVKADNNDCIRFFKRNFRLFTPADFDYSPYFEVIKFPVWGSKQNNKHALYHDLPWEDEDKAQTEEQTHKPSPFKIESFSSWITQLDSIKKIIKHNINKQHNDSAKEINNTEPSSHSAETFSLSANSSDTQLSARSSKCSG